MANNFQIGDNVVYNPDTSTNLYTLPQHVLVDLHFIISIKLHLICTNHDQVQTKQNSDLRKVVFVHFET